LEKEQSGTQIAHFGRGELEMALSVSEVLPGISASTTRRQIWSTNPPLTQVKKSCCALL
jgi:hypothetical protein